MLRLSVAALLALAGSAHAQSFRIPRDTTLTDERVAIVLEGARPGSLVSVRLSWGDQSSQATFLADRRGTVDLSRMAPVRGSYARVEPMGLFWSVERSAPANRAGGNPARAVPFQLQAESGGVVIATDTLWRRAVSPGVTITPPREDGLVGMLYEPPGGGRRPAVIVLAGSGGGTPAAATWPGGLASRGYVVLSLAHFAEPGTPEFLSNIPLEYFERAMQWLRRRASVDSTRLVVLGTSRGGELALLLGATYPTLVSAVIGIVPSHVVWPGCCDAKSRLGPSWTLRGAPVPFMPPDSLLEEQLTAESKLGAISQTAVHLYRLSDSAAVKRSAIPVERIAGPVLLLSARSDGVWPSYEMASEVVARLKAHRFRYPVRHVAYEGSGHLIVRPFGPVLIADAEIDPRRGRRNAYGGSQALTSRAREEALGEILSFLDRHVRSGR